MCVPGNAHVEVTDNVDSVLVASTVGSVFGARVKHYMTYFIAYHFTYQFDNCGADQLELI